MSGSSVWLPAVYLLVLAYFTFHKDRWVSTKPLKDAWVMLSGAPLTLAVFALIKAGNYRDPRDLLLAEIWQIGFVWLFLGLSIYRLSGLLDDSRNN